MEIPMLAMIAAMVALTAQDEPTDWVAMGEATLAQKQAQTIDRGPAKNVILFIADGMDITTITAGRIHAGQQMGGSGEGHVLAFETLPQTALAKTYNTNMQTPDSAGTATAILSGQKTKAGVLNIHQNVARGDCDGAQGNELQTILEVAGTTGRQVGVISTARLTHATPAALYAASPDRDWEADTDLPTTAEACTDIASQLIDAARTKPITVALGGGRRAFLPTTVTDPEYGDATGVRGDGRNLIEAWETLGEGNSYVWNQEQFAALDPTADGAVLGLFEPSHMQYEADRQGDASGEPSLAEMTSFAIDKLSTDEDGYFLLVEGGRVDHAHHGGNARRALEDLVAFDAAVATAIDKTNAEETLIIVTADHGHTLVFQGYPKLGKPILGLVVGVERDGSPAERPYPAADGKPYTTLAYGNGPGSPFARPQNEVTGRPFVTDEEAQSLDYRQQAVVPSVSETHGGQDVSIYAGGPQSYLLNGVVEQNFIYYVMREALTVAD
jgi:alkaline phosphatase